MSSRWIFRNQKKVAPFSVNILVTAYGSDFKHTRYLDFTY